MNNIDFIIKTFKRYNCLYACLKSIAKYYPDAKIYVADDNSAQDFRSDFYLQFPSVRLIRLPFDSGLSYGRNAMIKASSNPYVLLLDDDFVFTEETKIENFLSIIESDNKIGIVGGLLLQDGQEVHYEHSYKTEDNVMYFVEDNFDWTEINGLRCKQANCVLNFGLFRRELFNDIQWDNDLKVVEHTDFYYRLFLLNKWKIFYTPEVKVIHRQQKDNTPEEYREYRYRVEEFFKKFFDKFGLVKHIDSNGNVIFFEGNKMVKQKIKKPQ